MTSIRKVHCMFEQSGTFKKEFIKMGIPAEDYDIQNNFGETDHVIDLFAEINSAYEGGVSVFNSISQDDLIMAFFPCIYFTGYTNPLYFTLENNNYCGLTTEQKFEKILKRADDRNYFFKMLIMLVAVCMARNIPLVIENPSSSTHYLVNNFLKAADVIDKDRTRRGDYMKKPTQYWFFNCTPTYGESFEKPEKILRVQELKGNVAGLCSEERSMIAPAYARNFICDFILGKPQGNSQLMLFN